MASMVSIGYSFFSSTKNLAASVCLLGAPSLGKYLFKERYDQQWKWPVSILSISLAALTFKENNELTLEKNLIIPFALCSIGHLAAFFVIKKPTTKFEELSSNVFFQKFATAKQIWTGEVAPSGNGKSISSVEMDDCITIFGIHKSNNGQISDISGYHASSDTEKEEMIDEYFEWFQKDGLTSFYLIGGNRESTKDGNLLTTIHGAVQDYFGNTACIQEELTGINDGGEGKYSTANLQIDGTITFCFHQALR